MPRSAEMPPQTPLATLFSVQSGQVSGNQIGFDYETMAGNQPHSYENTVFLWQTPAQSVPINTPPKKSDPILSTQPDGSQFFKGLDIENYSYLLGYAVGKDVKNVVATVFVPTLNGGSPVSQPPSVTVDDIGSTSVSVQYTMPGGMQPQSDGDWIGIWEGEEALLYSEPPMQHSAVDSDSNNGFTAMNLRTGLRRGSTYTIGYFKGGYESTKPNQQTLAASTTFTA